MAKTTFSPHSLPLHGPQLLPIHKSKATVHLFVAHPAASERRVEAAPPSATAKRGANVYRTCIERDPAADRYSVDLECDYTRAWRQAKVGLGLDKQYK